MIERKANVRGLYIIQAQLLRCSPSPADQALGAKVEAFLRSMPRPESQRLQMAHELRAAARIISDGRSMKGASVTHSGTDNGSPFSSLVPFSARSRR